MGGDEFVVLGVLGEDEIHDAVDAAVLAARQGGGEGGGPGTRDATLLAIR
ncbi:hypothetical protein GCM10010840_29830 [Deinococcus aerolatus]|uniref:GGDEF domain-containing protein n=1 Tax=Deinococcus aerolatus TaxID=522487 RepID=A0ABQ2GDR8_9DEIO|nr:hypothetical protein [Deinococcus aerolatus]GGL89787.1 hypothetical protein GCM10010840_29830 [Deinococcus aerolatus]